MSKTLTEAQITTAKARSRLELGVHWRRLDAEAHLGYRKGKRGGVWLVRWRMAQSPQPYDLGTRACTIHAGRVRWDIRENGRPVQSSMESFATDQEAHADGRHELEKIILVSRL